MSKNREESANPVLPADLCVSETLHVVLASPRPSSLLGLLVVVAVVGLAVGARGAVLQFGAHVAVAVVGLRLTNKKGRERFLKRSYINQNLCPSFWRSERQRKKQWSLSSSPVC